MPAPRDLHELFAQHASARPARVLVSSAGSREEVSASDLQGLVRQRAGQMAEAGVSSGAIVLLAGLGGTDFLSWLLAAWACDAAAIPADPLVTDAELRAIRRCIPAAWQAGAGGLTRLRIEAPPLLLPAGAALIKLTSGTTGAPRGIQVTADQILADGTNLIEGMGISPEDTNVAAIPLSHSYGLGSLVMPLVIQGSPILLAPARASAPLADALSVERPAIFPGVPSLYEILGRPDAPRITKRGLRLCLSAGAPLLSGTAAAFAARTGLPVRAFYGASETGGIAYDASPGGLAAQEEGCVGTPLPGVSIALDVEERRVVVRGSAVASGYADRAAENPGAGRFLDGAFMTSDTGRLDADGRLSLTGRVASFVNIAGRKVNPAEVESCLATLRGVRAAAVIGLSDAARGESLGACVVADEGLRRGAVVAHLQGKLAPWKVPRRIIFMSDLPVTPRGKVDAAALRRRLGDGGS